MSRALILDWKQWPGIVVAAVAAAGAAVCHADDDLTMNRAIVELVEGASIQDVVDDYPPITLEASIDAHNLFLLSFPIGWDEETLEAFVEDVLEADPRVDEADLNEETEVPGGHTQSFHFFVDPAAYQEQYVWPLIDLQPPPQGSERTIVAILDTGIDRWHEVFAQTEVLPGYDFVDRDLDPADSGDGIDNDGDLGVDELVGHGTAMSNLVVKVAPLSSLLPVRVLNSDGFGDTFTVVEGLYYAADFQDGEDRVSVINLSLGVSEANDILLDAILYALEKGILVVSASGNDGLEAVLLPAGYEPVVAVASTDEQDLKSSFSNYGEEVVLSAPGSAIVTAVPDNQYGQSDGTSSSAALVSGTVALLLGADPTLTPDAALSVVAASSTNLDALNQDYEDMLGAGRIDVGQALEAIGVLVIPGDLDGDGIVSSLDLLLLLGAWGPCPPKGQCPADLDHDGVVGSIDLLILLGEWS